MLDELSRVHLAAGQLDDAETLLVECVGLLGDPDTPPLLTYEGRYFTLASLAWLYKDRGEHELGLATQAEAVAYLSKLAHLQHEWAGVYGEEQSALAQAFAERGHPPGAALLAERDGAERWGLGIS